MNYNNTLKSPSSYLFSKIFKPNVLSICVFYGWGHKKFFEEATQPHTSHGYNGQPKHSDIESISGVRVWTIPDSFFRLFYGFHLSSFINFNIKLASMIYTTLNANLTKENEYINRSPIAVWQIYTPNDQFFNTKIILSFHS